MPNEETTPIKVFISYAHADDRLKVALEKQLSFLKRQGFISAWNDRDIQAGQEWKHEIDRHLTTAQFILLLISPDFMASEYCYSVEMIEALKKHEAGEARVIPIILRPTDWEGAPFSKLQVLPIKAKPITRWKDRDEAFLNVVQGIRRAIQEFRSLQDNALFGESYKVDWGEAPDPGQFYGREKELSALKHWIVDEHSRMVAVVGIGGMGKSSLVATLIDQVRESFDYIFWRSLHNAPPLHKILKECILFFSDQRRIELSENEDEQVLLLIQYLRDHRCLLVLDNFESALQGGSYAGQYREGYRAYGKLLQQVGQARHQSCLLLTSREKPKEVADLEGASGSVHSLPLAGLISVEGQEILKNKGLSGVDEALADLVDLYSGNPLALKLVAEPINELFQGDISRFLQEDRAVVSNIYALLGQQFHRLSEAEQGIMYWLAIEREPVTLDTLREDMVDPSSKKEVLAVLQSLRRRSMIEASGIASFTLQPVIMEYVTDSFVERVSQEFGTETLGLLRSHALMKARSKEYVRESQVRLIVMPIAQQMINSVRRAGLAEKCTRILAQLRAMYPEQPAYVAGNVLNLLTQLKYDLQGYDFSHLAVWQAYLQGISLYHVNFAYAHFANCAFTDTFGGIISVIFSSNGNLIAAGTTNNEVRLWDVSSGTPVRTFQGHTEWVRSVAFNFDNTMLATGSEDNTVRLWDVNSGQCLRILDHNDWVYSVAFSPDGKSIVSGSGSHDKTIKLWDTGTGECLKTLQGHVNLVWSVAFSPDGNSIVSGSEDKTVRLWDVNSGQCLKTLEHSDRVYTVAFSPDGNSIASGGEDKMVRLWDVSSGQCLKTLVGHAYSVWSVAFSSDAATLASGSDDETVRLWDVSSGQCLKTLIGHTDTVWSVAFSPDETIVISGSLDQTIRLWDVSSSGKCLKTLQGYTNAVLSVAFSPDGDLLASGSEDKLVRLWDTNRGFCLKSLPGHVDRVWSVAFSPDGTLLASSSIGIRLWDVDSGQQLKAFPEVGWMYSVAFHPNGKILVISVGNPCLWDVGSGQLLNNLQGHAGLVWTAIFSPDGTSLASGGEDKTVRLWDVSSGQCLKTLIGHTGTIWSVAFSPDGTIIGSGSQDGTVRLWDITSGECLKTLQDHTGKIWSIAFSPDGAKLASGSEDGTIKLWNIRTGECLHTLRSDRPYERMNITGVRGMTLAQQSTLKALGAFEDEPEKFD